MGLSVGLSRQLLLPAMVASALALALGFSFLWIILIRLRHFPLDVTGSVETHRCVEGDYVPLILRISGKRGHAAPGVVVVARLHWHGRGCTASGRVFGTGTAVLQRLPRGTYPSATGAIAYRDPLGLCRLVQTFEFPLGLRVVPSVAQISAPAATRGTGGGDIRFDVPRVRNEILIEHRPYTPGDDSRRIHWKMSAHTGELFMRRGEEVPPPSQIAYVIADTTSGAGAQPRTGQSAAAGQNRLNRLDTVLRTALGIAEDLVSRGLEVRIGTTGSGMPFQVVPTQGRADGAETERPQTRGRSIASVALSEVQNAWADQYFEANPAGDLQGRGWPSGTILVSAEEDHVTATVV